MKKSLIIILFLFFVACSPGFENHSSYTPVAMKTAITVSTILPQTTQAGYSLATAVSVETAVATSTALPTLTPTRAADKVVERVYDPNEWKPLYDKNTVWQIELNPAGRMWISPGGEVGYFDGNRWVLFSPKDCLLPRILDMAIAPDGAVWVSGLHALSRYRHGHWETFPIPDVDETAFPRMAIDASGAVWVSMSSCSDCGYLLKKFDGKNWSVLQLWTTERTLNVPHILFTPDGALWVAYDGGEIGRYDGRTWKIYSGMGLWSREAYYPQTIRIASDNK